MIVTSEFGMGGIASGSQMHVTNTDMCRSNDVPSAIVAISMSIGANHSMDAIRNGRSDDNTRLEMNERTK